MTNAGAGGPAAQDILEVRALKKHFPLKSGRRLAWSRRASVVHAVDGVSFSVRSGETLGIVGESGCGKSTLARLLMNLLRQDEGDIVFAGTPLGRGRAELRSYRRQVQMVFQDSYSSLNPRMTIEDSLVFGPVAHGIAADEALHKAHGLLRRVGLDPVRFAGRYPHELSGGQRQRVNIARALMLGARVIILDESVSALDKSVEAQVLNLLEELKQAFGLTYIFISHDLHVIRHVCDRVLVMYLGQVVELGPVDEVFGSPRHPYTRALIRSVPSGDPEARIAQAPLSGDPPNPIDPPSGCRFHPRCPEAQDACAQQAPRFVVNPQGHGAACLRWMPAGVPSALPSARPGAEHEEVAHG